VISRGRAGRGSCHASPGFLHGGASEEGNGGVSGEQAAERRAEPQVSDIRLDVKKGTYFTEAPGHKDSVVQEKREPQCNIPESAGSVAHGSGTRLSAGVHLRGGKDKGSKLR